jgi:hypothetical protein
MPARLKRSSPLPLPSLLPPIAATQQTAQSGGVVRARKRTAAAGLGRHPYVNTLSGAVTVASVARKGVDKLH